MGDLSLEETLCITYFAPVALIARSIVMVLALLSSYAPRQITENLFPIGSRK
jgi:hypothetical protein